ncbi:MAG: TAT-variant-translocated molybdopterin oxidoreductase [Bacteroidia bacterium]|nr:TAT-variant-translocated molybdopterin oxidoreductase [Bacteroidia bacterium]
MEEYKRNDYWNGLEEYNNTPQYQEGKSKEFKEDLPLEDALSEESLGVKANRRDFLKIFGFGLTAAALAACETPVKKAIPFVVKPDTVTPGVANWYASTCQSCAAGCGILVKTREGRPIKVEGNPSSPFSKGGVCATGQASVLNLYDSTRMQKPSSPWADLDAAVASAVAGGGKVVVLTPRINSPVSLKIIKDFLAQAGSSAHVQYSPAGIDAIALAHQNNFGSAVTPTYKFQNADVVVSFGADFLGTWISPVEFTKGYSSKRKVNPENPKMSKHYQFESIFSLTGSNADLRIPVDAGQDGAALLSLYNLIAAKAGQSPVSGVNTPAGAAEGLKAAADSLWSAKGHSLVVSGSNNVAMQEVVNAINSLLGNYGKTIDMDTPSNQAGANYGDMVKLVSEMNAGGVATLIMVDVNPVYNYHDSATFAAGLAKVKNVVALSYRVDETAALATIKAPINHSMESWDVLEPKKGHYSIVQPTVRPLFDTRQWQESLLAWTKDASSTKMLDACKAWFTSALYNGAGSTKAFWEKAVKEGGYSGSMAPMSVMDAHEEMHEEDAAEVAEGNSAGFDIAAAAAAIGGAKDGKAIVVYQKVGVLDGHHANNPHIMELPDPMTKVCWDNFVTIPYTMAKAESIIDGDLMKVAAGGYEVTLPAVVLPAQAANTVGICVGYGRTAGGRVINNIGKNAYPFAVAAGNQRSYTVTEGVSVSKTGEKMTLAKTQYYTGYDLRDEGGVAGGVSGLKNIESRIDNFIVKDTTLDQYKEKKYAGNENRAGILHENSLTLWKTHKKKGYHWGMSVDLNSCTGCSACVVSCHTENNVPMVGKKEVATRRDMHWMRIDRYFKGNPDAMDGSLQVAHQPLMCQHCDNAPCETVCPVLATVHSDEGLNQQVYNRCVGTRYCANNCPYKVRRFNWFSYYSNDKFNSDERNAPNGHMFDSVGSLVLNPDVVIRARGVMEKCSMCVQRIQEGKLKAKVARKALEDGAIKTACQQSCPADAIVFGDLNDPESAISKHFSNERFYHALEEVKTLPTVGYMTKIRNNNTPEWHKMSEATTTNTEV